MPPHIRPFQKHGWLAPTDRVSLSSLELGTRSLLVQDGSKLFSGGCDGHVKMFDLATGQATTLHTHDKPVKCVEFVNALGQEILVTAGWDKQLRVSVSMPCHLLPSSMPIFFFLFFFRISYCKLI